MHDHRAEWFGFNPARRGLTVRSLALTVLAMGACDTGGKTAGDANPNVTAAAGTSAVAPVTPAAGATQASGPMTMTTAPATTPSQAPQRPAQPATPPPSTPTTPAMTATSTPATTSSTPNTTTPPTTNTPPPATTPTTDASGDAGHYVRGEDPTADSATKAGPFQVGQITDGFRDGPDFGGATIYYPKDAEPPFAMIVFCPGWLGNQSSDQKWAPFMTSYGIVFMNIDTNAPGDSVDQRQAAEVDALQSLLAENTRQASPLFGKLDADRVSLMGWSMGGGGAWMNAKKNPKLKAIITLAGHDLTAGGAQIASGITVPTLMFAGTADDPVLGLGMSQPVYEIIPDSTPKMLYEVSGADHFAFNDPAFLDGVPARYALSWEKVYLEGDMRYYKFLLEKGPQASDFRTNLK